MRQYSLNHDELELQSSTNVQLITLEKLKLKLANKLLFFYRFSLVNETFSLHFAHAQQIYVYFAVGQFV